MEFIKKIDSIFKAFPKLDMQIRTIENELNDEGNVNNICYVAQIGLYESLGEQGEILTLIFDTYPTTEEIIKDVKENLRDTLKELRRNCFTAREEQQLKCLKKIKENLK